MGKFAFFNPCFGSPIPDTCSMRGRPQIPEILMSDSEVKDSNGATLNEGDAVIVMKDLKLKGASETLKRGTVIKNINLTSSEEEVEYHTGSIKELVLKTCFLMKA
jgi:protein PhnA